jgi:hypothetical protein
VSLDHAQGLVHGGLVEGLAVAGPQSKDWYLLGKPLVDPDAPSEGQNEQHEGDGGEEPPAR